MKRIIWSVFVCMPLMSMSLTVQAASFDCGKASTKIEKLICGDAELSKLDETLSKAYQQALRQSLDKQKTTEEERLWLKNVRNLCQYAECLKAALQTRIRELTVTPIQSKVPLHLETTTPASGIVNEIDKELFEAVNKGDINEIVRLVNSGASPNTQDVHGDTPLASATNLNNREVVKLLLERGADPNLCQCTLLASTGRDTEILRMLVAAGANVNVVTSKYGYTPLEKVAENQNETFEELRKTAGFRGPAPNSVESARILIAAGANVNHVDAFGESPLRAAMRVNNLDLARVLLKSGADVHQRSIGHTAASENGDTILMETIWWYPHFKDISAIRLLLDFGANPNDRNETDYDDICESRGSCDWQGYSVLGFAAKSGLTDVAKLLLEQGANPAYGRNDGRSPVEISLERGHKETAALLKRYLSKKSTPPAHINGIAEQPAHP